MFIWYIFVLFVYTAIICPLLQPFFKEQFAYWISFALILYFIPRWDHIYMDRVATYFVFFVIGGALRHHETLYYKVIDTQKLLWLMIPAFLALLLFIPLRPVLVSPLGLLIAGVMSIPILHAISRKLLNKGNGLTVFFCFLGGYSYIIYLLNVIAIGVVKGVMFHFTTWDGWHFWYFIPILIVAGVAAPIMAEILILQHIPFIREKILGKTNKLILYSKFITNRFTS
jgi:hypothetical protein